jgi:tetratricopeptide (TPR) repeat protein
MRQLTATLVLFVALLASASGRATAAASDPEVDPLLDPAPCMTAAATSDADRIIAVCGELIDSDKTSKPDRIAALTARAAALAGKQQFDRALSDYDAVLGFDPKLADVFYARGEVWRAKGDRRRALADFAAAFRLDPDHAAARASHKAMAQELERQGALMAVVSRPSFDCLAATRKVERAICADQELSRLDREIEEQMQRAAKTDDMDARGRLWREHRNYLRIRNEKFGDASYDLRQAMKDRLRRLTGP